MGPMKWPLRRRKWRRKWRTGGPPGARRRAAAGSNPHTNPRHEPEAAQSTRIPPQAHGSVQHKIRPPSPSSQFCMPARAPIAFPTSHYLLRATFPDFIGSAKAADAPRPKRPNLVDKSLAKAPTTHLGPRPRLPSDRNPDATPAEPTGHLPKRLRPYRDDRPTARSRPTNSNSKFPRDPHSPRRPLRRHSSQ